MNGNRIISVDYAKAIGIYLVVLAHTQLCAPLTNWIYVFHMPLFFLLSGYVFNNNPSFKEFINRKAKTLVFPYFTLGIPMVVFTIFINLYKGLFSVDTTIELLKSFIFQK